MSSDHFFTLFKLFPQNFQANDWLKTKIIKKPCFTWDFIINDPDFQPDWSLISKSRHITWEIIKNNPQIPWHWPAVSQNPNITWEIIKNNPGMPWSWRGISQNPNITWEIVKNNPQFRSRWNFSCLSKNFGITMDQVRQSLYEGCNLWSWYWLSHNENITWDFIEENFNKFQSLKSGWHGLDGKPLRFHPCIPLEMFEKYPPILWYPNDFIHNPNLTINMLVKHHQKLNVDDWFVASKHKNITWRDIKNHPELRWNKKGIAENSNITMDIVYQNIDFSWPLGSLSRNPNIDRYMAEQILEKCQNDMDDIYCVCKNPATTWDMIKDTKPLTSAHISGFSFNPNLTWKIVVKNPQLPWNWSNIVRNKFDRYNAAIKIQRWWRKCKPC